MLKKTFILGLLMALLVILSCGLAQATIGPITFATDSDYDNNSPQALGLFRDFLSGDKFSRGDSQNPSGTKYTALNHTTGAAITVYDTTPASATLKDLFTGSLTLSADVMTTGTNTQSPGLLALFNEGAGSFGVVYRVLEAGNTDHFYISKVAQNGTTADFNSTGNSGWLDYGQVVSGKTGGWYRMEMDVNISDSSITITGKTYTHTDVTNPNSALGTQLGSTLTYTSTLSGMSLDLTGQGEVGFACSGQTTGSSITNFKIEQIPEPATVGLLGLGALSLIRRKKLA